MIQPPVIPMRPFLLLPLLLAPLPAAAQSGSQVFCFANETHNVPMRARIREFTASGQESAADWTRVPGGSRHCVRLVRPAAVRFEVQQFISPRWEGVPTCSRTLSQPGRDATLRATGSGFGFMCHWM